MKNQAQLSGGINGCGIALFILGTMVMIGWHTHVITLIQIKPYLFPMAYNTALCFLFLGASLIFLNRKMMRQARILITLVFIIAGITLSEYLFQFDAGVDNLLMTSFLPQYDGRMSINATVGFLCGGLALWFFSWPYSKVRLSASLLLTLVILSIGLLGIISYQFNLVTYLGSWVHMALHTALGFIILGTGLILWICLTKTPEQYVPLLPLTLTFFILIVTVFSWKMVNHLEKNYLHEVIVLKADHMNKLIRWNILERVNVIRHLGMLEEEWKEEARRYVADQQGYQTIQLLDKDAKVRWSVPQTEYEQLQGSNLKQTKTQRQVILNALASKTPQLSEKVKLNQGENGFIIVSPVFKNNQLDGYMVANINTQQFFDDLFTKALGQDYTLRVYENSELLYSRGLVKPSLENKWAYSTYFSLLGKNWKIKVGPTLLLYKHIHTTIFSGLILIIGSLIAILSGVLLRLYQVLKRNAIKLNDARMNLAHANDQLKGIIEGSSDLIAALDLNYNFMTFNTMYKKEVYYLFKIDIVIGMNFKVLLDKMSPSNQQKAINLWKKAFEGHTFTVIESFQDKKFTDLNYEIHYNPIYDAQGNLIGASHIASNVSQRIYSEKRLTASKAELERAVERLETQNNELKLLKEMMSLLQSSVSMNDAVSAIESYVKIVLKGTKGAIYLKFPESQYFNKILTWSKPLAHIVKMKKNACWCLMRGQLHQVLKVENGVVCHHVRASEHKPEAYLCCPLHVQGDVFGLLYIEVSESALLTQHLVYISQLMSEQIGLSLFNIQLRERLQAQSTHDSLTGLYNRLFLENYVNSALSAKRKSLCFSLLLIDVDFFKKINDTFGHLMGDEVLTAIAQQLRTHSHTNDLICRWGGEEFLIYLPENDSKIVKARAETFRHSIEKLALVINEISLPKLSISIGVAFYPKDGKDLNHLLIKADEALYHAKKMGRNRVIMNSI